jgi:hypothetical protein
VTTESPALVFKEHAPLMKAAEFQRSEVDSPDPVVDFLRPHVLADTDMNPLGVGDRLSAGRPAPTRQLPFLRTIGE